MPKVRVPQNDGEIVLTTADGSTTYKVSDGEVTVKDADLPTFLGAVEGSKEVAKPAASTKEK